MLFFYSIVTLYSAIIFIMYFFVLMIKNEQFFKKYDSNTGHDFLKIKKQRGK